MIREIEKSGILEAKYIKDSFTRKGGQQCPIPREVQCDEDQGTLTGLDNLEGTPDF